jgi:hypothetical protein
LGDPAASTLPFLPMLAGGRFGPANRSDENDEPLVGPVPSLGGAGAAAPQSTNVTPPSVSPPGGPPLGGTAGSAGLSNTALVSSAGNLPAWDGRIGGDGQAGIPREAGPILVPASLANSYHTPGFWPPGMYGPAGTQLAGSPVAYGHAGPLGSGAARGFVSDGGRRLGEPAGGPGYLGGYGARDEHPSRLAGVGPPSRTPAPIVQRRQVHDAAPADQELGRGRVVPDARDEAWAPGPAASPPDGVVTPAEEHETPDTFASVAALAMPMLVGAARRRDDEDEDGEHDTGRYRDEPRRGLADGVVDGGDEL